MDSSAIKDVSKLMVGTVLAKALGMGVLIFFTRILSKQEMAAFPAFLLLAGLCDLILTLGMFSQFLRELPSLLRENLPRARSLIMTASGLIVLGTIVPAIGAIFVREPIARIVFGDASLGWVIALMTPGFIAYVISRITDQVMWGGGRYGETAIVQVVESFVRPSLTIMGFFTWGFAGVVAGIVLAQFIMAVVSLWLVRDLFLGPLPPIYPVRKLVLDSLPYYLGNYLSYLRSEGDSALVAIYLGPSALAEYYVAYTIFNNVMLIMSAVDRVAVERLARSVNDAFFARVRDLHEKIARSMVPLVLFVVAITPQAMVVLAGARYTDAVWPAIVLLFVALMRFVSISVDRTVFIVVPGSVRVWYAIMETVTVFGLAMWLAPVMGLVGIASARVVAHALTMGFGLLMIYRRTGETISLRSTIGTVAVALPGTLVALLLVPRGANPIGSFLWSAVSALVWIASFVAASYVFNRSGLEYLVSLARREIANRLGGWPLAKYLGHSEG